MSRSKRKQHVLSLLTSREYSGRNNYRTNLKALRTLVCGDSYEFKKVWDLESINCIVYERNTLFTNNYRTCFNGMVYQHIGKPLALHYTSWALHRKVIPDLVRRLDPQTQVTCTDPVNQPGAKIYAMTSTDLIVIDFERGHPLAQVKLLRSSAVKLKDIYWNELEYSFVLSSSNFPRINPGQVRPFRVQNNCIKVIAVFSIMPLEFVCMFEVCRDVFGANVKNAFIHNSIIVVTDRSSLMRLYDFNDVLRDHRITPQPVRSSDFEPTFNLKITELPCCLFEVQSEDGKIEVGGFPWHHIISRMGFEGHYDVCSMKTGRVIQNGSFEPEYDITKHRVEFHHDESGRIINVTPTDVRILSLKEEENGEYVLIPSYTIPIFNISRDAPPPTVTSSGRVVKRRSGTENIAEEYMAKTIQDVDYEDELDLTVITTTQQVGDHLIGKVELHDNATGQCLRSIETPPKKSWWEHMGRPFQLNHISRALHRSAIPDQCLKAHAQSLCAVEVLKCFDQDNCNTPSPTTWRYVHMELIKRY